MSGIIRVVKDKGYFVASNTPFNDKRLTWEARGVLAYLLSKPDGWITRNQDLINNGPAGERVIERVLKELQKFGYMHRERIHQGGKLDWVTSVFEKPNLQVESHQLQYPQNVSIQDVSIQDVGIYKELNLENTNNHGSDSNNGWGELLAHFTKVTGIPEPIGLSDEKAAQYWFEPLAAIYKTAGNMARTKDLITDTVEVLRSNSRYNIKTPHSLQTTATKLAANGKYSALVVSDV